MHRKYDRAETKADERVERYKSRTPVGLARYLCVSDETEAPVTDDSKMSGDLNEAMKKVQGGIDLFSEMHYSNRRHVG